jgi:hypothetical protein
LAAPADGVVRLTAAQLSMLLDGAAQSQASGVRGE